MEKNYTDNIIQNALEEVAEILQPSYKAACESVNALGYGKMIDIYHFLETKAAEAMLKCIGVSLAFGKQEDFTWAMEKSVELLQNACSLDAEAARYTLIYILGSNTEDND